MSQRRFKLLAEICSVSSTFAREPIDKQFFSSYQLKDLLSMYSLDIDDQHKSYILTKNIIDYCKKHHAWKNPMNNKTLSFNEIIEILSINERQNYGSWKNEDLNKFFRMSSAEQEKYSVIGLLWIATICSKDDGLATLDIGSKLRSCWNTNFKMWEEWFMGRNHSTDSLDPLPQFVFPQKQCTVDQCIQFYSELGNLLPEKTLTKQDVFRDYASGFGLNFKNFQHVPPNGKQLLYFILGSIVQGIRTDSDHDQFTIFLFLKNILKRSQNIPKCKEIITDFKTYNQHARSYSNQIYKHLDTWERELC